MITFSILPKKNYSQKVSRMNDLSDYIGDFTGSEHFLFITGAIKEYAEQLLHTFATNCRQPVSIESVESAMNAMARLDLPLSVKTELPELLTSFFSYLGSSGKIPSATSWEEYPQLAQTGYCALFREDGSVRGSTFKKQYSATGRNEPCPCGSGKKFKRCCGRE